VRAKVELARRLLAAKTQLQAKSRTTGVMSSLSDDGDGTYSNVAYVDGRAWTLADINAKLCELSTQGPYLELEIVETKRKDRGLYFAFTSNAVRYSVVRNAFKRAGFKELEQSSNSDRWNALWGRPRLKLEEYEQFNDYQRFCHFPGSFQLGRKDNLHRNLSRMRRHFGASEYGFFPESFLLPEDKDLL
jgi:Tubulin-tyrosine ligase family